MKRRVVKGAVVVGVLLLAGAVCSVGVAWGIEAARAYRESFRYPTWTLTNRGSSLVVSDPRDQHRSLMYFEERWLGRSKVHVHSTDFGTVIPPSSPPPRWVRMPEFEGNRSVTGYGFPLLCMQHERHYKPDGSFDQRSALCLTYSTRALTRVELPLRRIWMGFMVNTLVYSSVIRVLWQLVRATRRDSRFVRGCCVFCNYDLRGDYSRPCSECGRTREGRLVNEPGTE